MDTNALLWHNSVVEKNGIQYYQGTHAMHCGVKTRTEDKVGGSVSFPVLASIVRAENEVATHLQERVLVLEEQIKTLLEDYTALKAFYDAKMSWDSHKE